MNDGNNATAQFSLLRIERRLHTMRLMALLNGMILRMALYVPKRLYKLRDLSLWILGITLTNVGDNIFFFLIATRLSLMNM